jgi:hypothetical protein
MQKSQQSIVPELDPDEFEQWKQEIPNRLEFLVDTLPAEIQLDFTLSSCEELCNWALDQFPDLDSIDGTNNIRLLDSLGTYIGEIIVRALGVLWTTDMDPSSVSYKLPNLVWDFIVPLTYFDRIFPHIWLTVSISRRRCVIRERFERLLEAYNQEALRLPRPTTITKGTMMKQSILPRLEPDEFGAWEREVPNRIEFLAQTLHEEIKFDFSLDSLAPLASWFLFQYKDVDYANSPESLRLIDCAATYIGQSFMKHCGGVWKLQSDPDYAYFGLPGITNYKVPSTYTLPLYPHTWITASIPRQYSIVEHRIEFLTNSENTLKLKQQSRQAKLTTDLDYYRRTVLIPTSADIRFADVVARMQQKFARITSVAVSQIQPHQLRIQASDWYLDIYWEDDAQVMEESTEIARYFASEECRSNVKSCAQRITTAATADPNMDHFNDYVFVLEVLESLPGVYQFDSEQGKLWASEDTE